MAMFCARAESSTAMPWGLLVSARQRPPDFVLSSALLSIFLSSSGSKSVWPSSCRKMVSPSGSSAGHPWRQRARARGAPRAQELWRRRLLRHLRISARNAKCFSRPTPVRSPCASQPPARTSCLNPSMQACFPGRRRGPLKLRRTLPRCSLVQGCGDVGVAATGSSCFKTAASLERLSGVCNARAPAMEMARFLIFVLLQ